MAYVYQSAKHVENVVRKNFRGKGILNLPTEPLRSYINEFWNMVNSDWWIKYEGVCELYNPFRNVTWWSVWDEVNSIDEYLEMVEELIVDYRKLEKVLVEEPSLRDFDDGWLRENTVHNVFKETSTLTLKERAEVVVRGQLTDEYLEFLESMEYVPGVYFLYNEERELIYVGKSTNLGSRILSSMREKGTATGVEAAVTETMSDCGIYESYYISKLKPEYNVEGKYPDDPTVELPDIRNYEIVDIYEEESVYDESLPR